MSFIIAMIEEDRLLDVHIFSALLVAMGVGSGRLGNLFSVCLNTPLTSCVELTQNSVQSP